ncbi:DgyrCDS4814 [Dimorphilus gyrociliatus]|uniref:DgyrCDS4814 n=1 Tax=Dimorphilus gyrociliatus TaxID=2664684 RepID=A0A7I8VI44_9ANNE|nr:DgyrCDS4814 [Dimorphilus gyrociliatus]
MAAINNSYKIRTNLIGHTQDVRCLTCLPDLSIVSGSRDCTCQLWVPEADSINYSNCLKYTGHENFVSCVTTQSNYIITGCNDKIIRVFEHGTERPLCELKGHSENVCTITACHDGKILSGSWDKTGRVWMNQKCIFVLSGHESAVWAVAILEDGETMLTGSADKTIRIWNKGTCLQTLKGHSDAVRSIAVWGKDKFLSCSNDASIKLWNINGTCLQTFYGHTNYVYSLSIINENEFISGGEDRSVKIWRNGECVQTISHPTESVWDVCVLPNEDIVTAASDGIIRIFSKNPERQAPDDIQEAYSQSVSSSTIPAQIGDINTDQLPSKSALLNPGKADGQTMMIKDGNNIEAYNWVAADGQWIKVGNVVGGASGNKTLYEGKEYDFVFDVDIQEGKPALKLPFNTTEDPWMAAHEFLERNDLSPLFLDQVAKFIVTNTKGATLGSRQDQGFADPFTGGNQYVPSSVSGSTTQAPAPPVTSKRVSNHFPVEEFQCFENINSAQIFEKLEKFNEEVDEYLQLKESELTTLHDLITKTKAKMSSDEEDTVWKSLSWSPQLAWPCLDILRLLVLRYPKVFCSERLFIVLKSFIDIYSAPFQCHAFTLRTFVNCFSSSEGRQLISSQLDDVLDASKIMMKGGNKHVQIAFGTLALNLTIAQTKQMGFGIETALSVLEFCCKTFTESEAKYRACAAIGTLLTKNDDEGVALAQSLSFTDILDEMTERDGKCDPRIIDCVKDIKKLLS